MTPPQLLRERFDEELRFDWLLDREGKNLRQEVIDFFLAELDTLLVEEREKVLSLVPEESDVFRYLSRDVAEFARQMREFLTNPKQE